MKGTVTSQEQQKKKRLISMDERSDAQLNNLSEELKTTKSDVVRKAISDLASKVKEKKQVEEEPSKGRYEEERQQEIREFNGWKSRQNGITARMDRALEKKRKAILFDVNNDEWSQC